MTDNKITTLQPSTSYTVDQALDSARQLGMKEVVVVGYDKDGGLVVRSSRMTRRDALWLTEELRRHVMEYSSD